MKNKYIHIVLVLLVVLISFKSFGVTIPDANFRAFLKTKYPSVINADQTLNVSAANAVTGQFKCYAQNITNLSGIEYFKNITSLEVKYNPNLQTLPDISTLTQITILGLDSNGLTSLPSLSSLTNLQILSCHHNQLSSLPSLSTLSSLQQILVFNNNLTSLPDLSALVNLQKLMCSDNPLNSLPSFSTLSKLTFILCQHTNISTIPALNNCPLLQYLICTHNNVTALPDLSNCPQLIEVKVFNCKLNQLPNFSSFANLTSVSVQNNELSFEDILPSISYPNFSSVFVLHGQSPGIAQNLTVKQLYPITIQLDFDNSVSSNVYAWYKDGVFIQNTTVNSLTLPSVLPNQEGIYTCKVTNTNPSLAGVTLNSKDIALKVVPCIVANNVNYTVNNTSCSNPISLVIDEFSFVGGLSPFKYTLLSPQDTISFTSNSTLVSKEGIYDLLVKDVMGCEVSFEKKIRIPRNEKCDPVFYPNGDGIADTYFIENTGTAKIYNKSGELVKEIITPGSWDGTNSKGLEAPTGLYVIIVGDNSIRVTLLR